MNKLIWLLLLLSWQVSASPDFSFMQQQAELASLAYAESTEIKKQLVKKNQPLIRHSAIAETEVSYFLTIINDVQVIAVRGTANTQNVMVDLDLQLIPSDTLGIQLHQGFANAASSIFKDIKPSLNKQQAISTTGHSLGGAVALILAMHLQKQGYLLTSVMTFGQPKVSNITGASKFNDLPLIRVVTQDDIVPLVPPLSPLQLKNLDIYWHSGEEIILMKANEFSRTEGLKSMMRATKILSAVPDERNLKAHQMTTYLDLIKGKLKSAKQVPYKTGISLFGLSLD